MNISTRLMTLIKCSANAAACSPTSRISSKLIPSSTGGQPISDAARKSSEKFIHTRLQTETVSQGRRMAFQLRICLQVGRPPAAWSGYNFGDVRRGSTRWGSSSGDPLEDNNSTYEGQKSGQSQRVDYAGETSRTNTLPSQVVPYNAKVVQNFQEKLRAKYMAELPEICQFSAYIVFNLPA